MDNYFSFDEFSGLKAAPEKGVDIPVAFRCCNTMRKFMLRKGRALNDREGLLR